MFPQAHESATFDLFATELGKASDSWNLKLITRSQRPESRPNQRRDGYTRKNSNINPKRAGQGENLEKTLLAPFLIKSMFDITRRLPNPPKTLEGKLKASHDAFKHGTYSRNAILVSAAEAPRRPTIG